MNKKAVLYPLFSEPLLDIKLDLDSKKMLTYLKNLKYRPTNNSEKCNQSLNNNLLKDPKLKQEKIAFEESVKYYLKNILHYSGGFKIRTSWATKTEKNGQSQLHVHRNSWLSACYYPEENIDFKITFQRTAISHICVDYDDHDSIYSAEAHTHCPEENSLIIFPSLLQHKIQKNKSKKNRYSFAFNIDPVGHFKQGSDGEIIYE